LACGPEQKRPVIACQRADHGPNEVPLSPQTETEVKARRLEPIHTAGEGFSRRLLARRSPRDPEAITFCFAYARTSATLPELAAATGLRWTIEECFLRAKDDLGLDHCEVRSWHGWHRHMTLVMAASAFLVRLSADQRRTAFSKPNKTSPQKQSAAA